MSDKLNEKGYGTSDSGSESGHGHAEVYERPKGFKGLYGHPISQVCMVGLVCMSLDHISCAGSHVQWFFRLHGTWSLQCFERSRWWWPSRQDNWRQRWVISQISLPQSLMLFLFQPTRRSMQPLLVWHSSPGKSISQDVGVCHSP